MKSSSKIEDGDRLWLSSTYTETVATSLMTARVKKDLLEGYDCLGMTESRRTTTNRWS